MSKRDLSNLLYDQCSKQLKKINKTNLKKIKKSDIYKTVKAKKIKLSEDAKELAECYYGNYCSRWRRCTYTHGEKGEENLCPDNSCNGIYRCMWSHKNDNELAESGKDSCIWGPWCYQKDCQLWHPKRLESYLGKRVKDRWYLICQLCGLRQEVCKHSLEHSKQIHIRDEVNLYRCQNISWGKQCPRILENTYWCSEHAEIM